jgi:hypothetical protein
LYPYSQFFRLPPPRPRVARACTHVSLLPATTTPSPFAYAGSFGFDNTGLNDNYTSYGILSYSLHYVDLTGLTPSTLYYYRVGSDEYGWSAPSTFTTQPPVGDKAVYPLSFIAYGDMGIEHSNWTAALTAEMLAKGQASFIIHAGDASYADDRIKINGGTITDGIQNDYYRLIQQSTSIAAYMQSVGNHESYLSYLVYHKRIMQTLPNKDQVNQSFWYSWTHGPVHFLAFSVEHPYEKGSEQYDFIVNDLTNVDRSVTPWVIAYAHRPLLCSNEFWCPEAHALQDALEPVFSNPASKVDLMLSGHVHAAELLYPQLNGTVVQYNFTDVTLPINLMIGYPGDIEVCCATWYQPQPAWSAWRADDVQYFGFTQITLANDTHMLLQMWDAVNRTVNHEQWVSRVLP